MTQFKIGLRTRLGIEFESRIKNRARVGVRVRVMSTVWMMSI